MTGTLHPFRVHPSFLWDFIATSICLVSPLSRESICWVKDIPWWKEGSIWWDEGRGQSILSRLRLLYLMRCNSLKNGYFCLTTKSLLRQSGWMFLGCTWSFLVYNARAKLQRFRSGLASNLFIWGNVVPVDRIWYTRYWYSIFGTLEVREIQEINLHVTQRDCKVGRVWVSTNHVWIWLISFKSPSTVDPVFGLAKISKKPFGLLDFSRHEIGWYECLII